MSGVRFPEEAGTFLSVHGFYRLLVSWFLFVRLLSCFQFVPLSPLLAYFPYLKKQKENYEITLHSLPVCVFLGLSFLCGPCCIKGK
jgi:hypothetical protein